MSLMMETNRVTHCSFDSHDADRPTVHSSAKSFPHSCTRQSAGGHPRSGERGYGQISPAVRLVAVLVVVGSLLSSAAHAAQLQAGAAKVDITNREAGPVNDPLWAKALVIKSDSTTAVIVTVDAVAIGQIGHIKNDYLGKVRSRIEKELGIKPANVMVNASHCHGVVCSDVDERTFQAVQAAMQNLVPVHVGVGSGHEDRISENRRLKLKNGKELDVRHAYSMPADEDVAEVGPIDPEIGLLRFDRPDGRTVAVV